MSHSHPDSFISKIEERNPLKQGLKQLHLPTAVRISILIEERNPLKQGLKLNCAGSTGDEDEIEERNPLKQGLKLSGFRLNTV